MTKLQRDIPIIVGTLLSVHSLLIPTQLHAFRAPEESKNTQNMQLKQNELLQQIKLTKIQQNNLKTYVGGNTLLSVKNIVENMFNKDKNGKLQSNIATLNAIVKQSQTDTLGFKHIRVTQEYKNIPIVGSEIVVHVNDKEYIYMINGKYQPDLNIDITPSISQDEALAIGKIEQSNKTNMHVSKKPSLVIYNGKLAWFYIIEHDGTIPGQWYYYIDAKKGKKLNYYNNIKYTAPNQGNGSTASVGGYRLSGEDGSSVWMSGFKENSGNYFLYSFTNLWGVYDTDVYDWEQLGSNNWGTRDRAAISCAKNLEVTQNYVKSVLGRNSFDNHNAFARADIHVDDNYVNAYWDGSQFNFGDGDGSIADALTVLDVVAHEYGHAITQYTSNLIYQDESGALNEAYSDILGAAVEFAKQSSGTSTYPNAQAGKSDWLMGEDCWLSSVALRDIKNPQRFGQPSYYHGTNWYNGTNDHGGVHTNSGVANFAYYLLAEGGSGSNDGHQYNISGIGKVQAAAVALRANYVYHTSTSDYADARAHWIQAARDLGYNTQTVAAVWTACGVFPPPPTYTILDTTGTWSTTSPDAIHRTGRYAQYYTFTLTKTTPIMIDLTSDEDTYLYLLDYDNNIIQEDDDGGSGTNSKINVTLSAGTYKIEATTYSSGAIGTFRIKVIGEGTKPSSSSPYIIPIPAGKAITVFL